MKKNIHDNLLLIIILAVAGILRLYSLGSSPVPLKWDEAALGYNAYSILKTGRDEYGSFLPVIFKSFGDYKPGLYIYSAVPSTMIFGLTEFATRLPSVIFGLLTILCVYFIVKRLFSRQYAFSASFVLAILPWHIEFSRGAWEANMAVFFITLGLLFFLLAEKNLKYLWLSAISFALTFLTYQGAKLFTPLFLGLIFIFFFQKITKLPRKHLFLSFCCALIIVIPVFMGIIFGQGGRLQVTSVFSYKRSNAEIQNILNQDKTSQDSLIFKIFHSENLSFARGIIQRYTNHFSARFLFFEGDWSNKRLGVPYMGHLYFIDFIFLIIGVVFLILSKKTKESFFVLSWLMISPIPAALTRDSVSAVRSLNMVIPLSIISGIGLTQALNWIFAMKGIKKIVFLTFVVIVYLWNIAYFLDQYFIHAPRQFELTNQYGYKEAVLFASSLKKEYKQIYFTQRYGQPYIYWLYYSKYAPQNYQKQAYLTESKWGDTGIVEHLDNITFKNIFWPKERDCHNCLFIDSEMGIHDDDLVNAPWVEVLKEIKYHDNSFVFRVVESQ